MSNAQRAEVSEYALDLYEWGLKKLPDDGESKVDFFRDEEYLIILDREGQRIHSYLSIPLSMAEALGAALAEVAKKEAAKTATKAAPE